ncbi:MAG: hypothetical protein AAB676_19800 [Verrucomicrobiota bacterium]
MKSAKMFTAFVIIIGTLAWLTCSCLAQTNRPPRIESMTLQEGIARLSVSGTPGSAFVIETSVDCRVWNLLSVTNASAAIDVPPDIYHWTFFILPEGRALVGGGEAGRSRMRFYRLRTTNALPFLVLTNLVESPP